MEEATAAVSQVKVRPFSIIRKVDPARLINFVKLEHPQTIALILTYLEPDKASVILESLPHNIQNEVARRIVTMDKISHEILHGIDAVLEKKFSKFSNEEYFASGGVENLVKIINHVGKVSRKQIVKALKDIASVSEDEFAQITMEKING